MLRWFPRLQFVTACFSCSPACLNFLAPYFIFMCMHYNHCHRATAHLQLNVYHYILLFFTNMVRSRGVHYLVYRVFHIWIIKIFTSHRLERAALFGSKDIKRGTQQQSCHFFGVSKELRHKKLTHTRAETVDTWPVKRKRLYLIPRTSKQDIDKWRAINKKKWTFQIMALLRCNSNNLENSHHDAIRLLPNSDH